MARLRLAASTGAFLPASVRDAERGYWLERLSREIEAWNAIAQRYLAWMDTLAHAPDSFAELGEAAARQRRRALASAPSLLALSRRLTGMDALLDLHGHPALSAELSAWLDRMADEYRRAKACAAQTVAAFESAAARACEFARRIDMRFLYLRDAQVLILDEPTAALDAVAEAEVFANFAQLTRERMAILISHRFSTVRLADRIVVLSGGRITEDGRHDELIASRGQCARLFEIQAANYR